MFSERWELGFWLNRLSDVFQTGWVLDLIVLTVEFFFLRGLTAAVLGVEVFVDGVERVLLFAAMFPGSQDVPYTLVQEGILALQHTHTHRGGNEFKCISRVFPGSN